MIKFRIQKIKKPIKFIIKDTSKTQKELLGKKKIKFKIKKQSDIVEKNLNLTKKFITISNEKGHWSPEEHKRFVEAIAKYGIIWEKVKYEVQTRSQIQIRSHAQKFFIKLKKCKSKELGIDFTSDNINSIKDMIKHIKSVNSEYDIAKIFLNLPKLCETKNKAEYDIENDGNIDINDNLIGDRVKDVLNKEINNPLQIHNINNNYNLNNLTNILYINYLASINNYLHSFIMDSLKDTNIANNTNNHLIGNYFGNSNNSFINNLPQNILDNNIFSNCLEINN